jgi:predicted nucleotidyltransferase component of viral defense system
MLERLLERIAVSEYKENFILKGGFLIAAIVGLKTRATMDMDVTVKGLELNEQTLLRIFKVLCSLEIDDPIEFELNKISEIREGDTYTGYRVSLTGKYPPMAVPLKLDITTGDKITPKEIFYSYKMVFSEGSLNVFAYNMETILAEKLETIISRGDQNTRPRDFYDVFILSKLKWNQIDFNILAEALKGTAARRRTENVIYDYPQVIDVIRKSNEMKDYWLKYQKDFEYASEILFDQALDSVLKLLDEISF